jgi:hypothetical protein
MLIAFFLGSVLCFSQAMRLFNHVVFLVLARPEENDDTDQNSQDKVSLNRLDQEFVGGVLNQGFFMNTRGMISS